MSESKARVDVPGATLLRVTSLASRRSSNERGHDFLADGGRHPDPFDPVMYLVVVVGDEEAAVEEAQEFYDRYYPAWDRLSPEEVTARGTFGPPGEVAETLEEYTDTEVENVVVRFTGENQRERLRRFADAADLG